MGFAQPAVILRNRDLRSAPIDALSRHQPGFSHRPSGHHHLSLKVAVLAASPKGSDPSILLCPGETRGLPGDELLDLACSWAWRRSSPE